VSTLLSASSQNNAYVPIYGRSQVLIASRIRRRVTALFVSICGFLLLPAHAVAYPTKSVRFVVAFSAGGITDIVARYIGQKLSERLGQSFFIDNRPGAGGATAAAFVSAAEPDGYTLLFTTAGIAIRAVSAERALDPRTQLTPVVFPASTPSIWGVNSSVTNQGMMEYLRSRKDQSFTYGSPGVGTLEHLTSEYLFKATAGLQSIHVPFQGGTTAVNAALGNQIDLVATAMPTTAALIQDGKIRIVAVAGRERMPQLPDAPTLREAGFPDVESASWVALFAPPNTPRPLVELLNKAVNEAIADPELRARLISLGFNTHTRSVDETGEYLAKELARWREITKTVGYSLK